MKYTVDAHGCIQQLSKTVIDGLGEAVGINYVSTSDKPTLMEHLARCDDTDYFERAIETAIAERGLRVRPLDISAYSAVEVDFEEDLARANQQCVRSAAATSPPLLPRPRTGPAERFPDHLDADR